MNMRKIFSRQWILSLVLPISLVATEVSVIGSNGEIAKFNLNAEDRFEEVINYIDQSLAILDADSDNRLADNSDFPKEIQLNLVLASNKMDVKAAKKVSTARNYWAPLTAKENDDLHYILDTLAQASLLKIGKSKSSLKKAGDRIDHIHPLRFLLAIFSDEQLKADIHAMRNRGWIWSEYMDGLSRTLNQEAQAGNLKPEFIQNFAATLGIDPNAITPLIQSSQWSALVDTLINTIPRKGPTDRYNI